MEKTVALSASYFRNIKVSPSGCVQWFANYRVSPTGRIPVVLAYVTGQVIDTALLAYAIHRRLDSIPEAYYRTSCKNKECVKGEHIQLIFKDGAPKSETSEEDIQKAIVQIIEEFPLAKVRDVLDRLRARGFHGKDQMLSQLLIQVRKEQGLTPNAVGRGRRKLLSDGAISDTPATAV